ncbi:transporter, major facilitator family protein [Leptospira yanagawae serovar Saopaulo str. Sao Paulo = ATCC 700523]|uniref:Transporter, major facilitator family protein n=1 Tax=Leptospira yanagawae serovar Saopaulo str. Sao Paulo = ATCC 700523 TaxID=1249483 RepID=A0A5E8HCK8_9LEPT|nr:MFS transporter [Leptospira yanagawae]EOQ89171.1 transporter, major facilitator family protein [Leptospira yanagawae serovar Saopaulo str. Sao Paulo = ATCC 700523]
MNQTNLYHKGQMFRFLSASFLGFLAGHLTNYSVILYAQDVWNQDALAGIGFGLCFGVPLFLGWFAGAWCDAHSPQILAQLAHISFLIALGLLNLSSQMVGEVAVSFFLLGAFFVGVGWSILAPARMSLLGRLAGEKQKKMAVIFNVLVMLGFGSAPPILAFCKRIGSWKFVHLTGVILFLIAMALLIGIKTEGQGKSSSAWDRILRGLSYAKNHELLKQTLLFSIVIYCSMGPVQVMMPRYAKGVLNLGELERGFFLGALALALLIGGGTSLKLAKHFGYGKLILTSGLICGLGLLGIGLSSYLWISIVLLLLSGFGAGASISLLVAILQSEVSQEYRGRLMSLYTITSQVVPAFAGLLSGLILVKVSIATAVLSAGVILTLIVIITTIRLQTLRNYNM